MTNETTQPAPYEPVYSKNSTQYVLILAPIYRCYRDPMQKLLHRRGEGEVGTGRDTGLLRRWGDRRDGRTDF